MGDATELEEQAAVEGVAGVGYVHASTLAHPSYLGPPGGETIGPVPEEDAMLGTVSSIERLKELMTRTQSLSTAAKELIKVLESAVENNGLNEDSLESEATNSPLVLETTATPSRPQPNESVVTTPGTEARPVAEKPQPAAESPRTHEAGERGRFGRDTFDDRDVQSALESFADAFNALFRETSGPGAENALPGLRARLEQVVDRAFENVRGGDVSDLREERDRLGLSFQSGDPEKNAMTVDFSEMSGLDRARVSDIYERFMTDERDTTRNGLLSELRNVLHLVERGIERVIGSRGVLLDIMA